MAELRSEEQNCPSYLRITAGAKRNVNTREPAHEPHSADEKAQVWQSVALCLISGGRQVQTLDNEDCLVCRAPTDEIVELVANLRRLLEGQREQVFFEPSEPSFELSLVRTRRGGIKVEAWLDAGNGTTAIYTWDACGVRFYTTDEYLSQFADQLEKEFAS
jgi:hypothetical protein